MISDQEIDAKAQASATLFGTKPADAEPARVRGMWRWVSLSSNGYG
jgi:hypothetical protein